MSFNPRQHHPKRELVRLEDLIVDDEFQRPLNQKFVKKVLTTFEPRAIRPIAVSKRPSNQYAVLDGQHRVEAIRQMGVPEDRQVVAADVYTGLSPADEAWLFHLFNQTLNVSPYARFKALVAAGDPEACHISSIVEKLGLTIGRHDADGVLGGVRALQRIYQLTEPKGRLLRHTLQTANTAWGTRGTKSQVLEGIAFYLEAHPDTDRTVLADRLSGVAGASQGLLGRARSLVGPTRGLQLREAVAQVIDRDIMKQRRKRLKTA